MRRPAQPGGDRRRWNPEASGHYGAARLRAYTSTDRLRKKKVAAGWLKIMWECADIVSDEGIDAKTPHEAAFSVQLDAIYIVPRRPGSATGFQESPTCLRGDDKAFNRQPATHPQFPEAAGSAP